MCGLMRPTICESVQSQDTLPGSWSIDEVGVSECGQEKKMHSGGREEGWEMLNWIGAETWGLGPCGADKGWVVEADDSGRKKEGKELKATSAPVLTASDVRPDAMSHQEVESNN